MNKGWECPKCGNIYAPFVTQCLNCANTSAPRMPFANFDKCVLCGNYHAVGSQCPLLKPSCTSGESSQKCGRIMRQKQEGKWPKLTPETKLSLDVAKFLEDRRKYFEATKDIDLGKF